MAKIENDKYYTSKELAKYCVNKTKEIIGKDNITEYIEPSAGNGVFLDYLDKPYIAYDIEPEDNRVIKQDWLTVNLEHKKGRCIIGNPPFGVKNNLTVAFYKKSILLADYIAFILPISQYKNDIKLYEFDLIYSENLGIRQYSDRKVHCCFNIYKRPQNEFNKRPNYKLKDVNIIERIKNDNPKRNKDFDIKNNTYDLRILGWGTGLNNLPLGGILSKEDKQYAKEFIIIIRNEHLKHKIIQLFKNTDWTKIYPMTATPNLLQWQVYKYIKEQIPEIN